MLHKKHVFVVLVAAGFAAGQTPPVHFEVASVKAAPASAGPRFAMTGGPGTADPTRIRYANVPLRPVLLKAFDVPNHRLLGPDWLNTLRYDIEAAVPRGATPAEFQEMLRNLMSERFHLKFHRESKDVAIYALAPARSGIKIPAAVADPAARPDQLPAVGGEGRDGFPQVTLPGPGIVIETKNGTARITAREVTFTRFADFLSGQLGRPVVDMTNASGVYSFALYYAPEGVVANDSPEPTIFGAAQEQLGLRLDARRGAVEYLVIDSADKVPLGN